MKITVLGAGHIGGTLGKKWAQAGHEVRFGVRDPQKPEIQTLITPLGGNASASSIEEAISFGEVILFAIPGATMEATISANAKALDGKIIIDAANKVGSTPSHSIPTFAAHTPNAKAYRAFNTYGWENFETPVFNGVPADQFFAGPNGESRSVIEKLISDIGLHPMYVGGSDQADTVDGLLRLWFALANGQKMGRHLALKVLTS